MTENRFQKSTPVQPRTTASQQPPTLLFVSHGMASSSAPTSHNNVMSHARRWQLDKKHRGQKISAQQEATYARSLVGWRSSTYFVPIQARPRQYPVKEIERDEEPDRERLPSPSTVLKRGQSDPFGALAVEVTPEVNEIV